MNGPFRIIKEDFRNWSAMRWWGLCVYSVAYVLLGHASQLLAFPGAYCPFWLPGGLAFAVFATQTRSKWVGVTAATFVAAVFFNAVSAPKSSTVLVGLVTANLAGPWVGALLVQWAMPGRLRLNQPMHVLSFLVCGSIAAPLVSSMIGAVMLTWATETAFLETFPSWFGGNIVGNVVACPPVVLTLAGFRTWWRRRSSASHAEHSSSSQRNFPSIDATVVRQYSSWFLLLLLTFLVTWFVFRISPWPTWFMGCPVLLILTIRYEAVGVSWGMVVVAWVTLRATADGLGDFATNESRSVNLLLSQLFLVTTEISFLTLAVSLQHRRRLSEKLARMQSQLAQLHRQTQLILDSIPSAVISFDLNNRLVRVNRSAADWLGLPRESLEGKRVESLGIQQVLGFATDHLRKHGNEAASVGIERELMMQDGDHRWVITDSVPIQQLDGHSMGRLAVMTDITARKAVERKLADSNIELERFASIASHDLKEPLRAVGGYCRLLWEDYHERLDPEGLRFLRSAIEGTSRMERLINDLLQYSRASQEPMSLRRIDLNEVVVGAQANLQVLLTEHNAQVTIESLPHVSGCFVPLVQTFQNILSNAIKFAKKDQSPRISIRATTHKPEDGAHEHVVSICDEGIGIAPEFHDRVFEVFERLHHNHAYDGSGLGLAICRRVMDRHGGRIELESTPGAGSTFRLYFPLVEPSALEFAA